MISILTKHEIKVINKKLEGKRISQQDSNYLSKYVRPKLRAIQEIDAEDLLNKLEYNQKAKAIEQKIKKLLLEKLEEVEAIVLYGSVVQNNYKNYHDIDVLVIIKKRFWKKLGEKYKKIVEIKKEIRKIKEYGINLDLEIYDKKTFYDSYPYNISLIYQLKDNKVIYGRLKLPKKLNLHKIDFQMKLDWSELEDIQSEGVDIYRALRNAILVKLLLNKIIDNKKLKQSLNKELGENLVNKLKNNTENKFEKKIALYYLGELLNKLRERLKGELWEKIEL